jgi:hypothetical protein
MVALAGQPHADVVIPLHSSDIAEGTVGPDALTFHPEDFDQPQAVPRGRCRRRRDRRDDPLPVDPASVTFTPASFGVYQNVTVTGVHPPDPIAINKDND